MCEPYTAQKRFPKKTRPGNVPRPRGPGEKLRANRKNKTKEAAILPPPRAVELPPARLKKTHGCTHVCTCIIYGK